MTVSCNIDSATLMLTIKVTDGANVIGELGIHPSDIKTRNWADMCLMHGLKQKLGDAAALGQFHKTGDRKGLKVTEADKWAAISELWAFMRDDNEWARRAAAGEGSSDGGLLLEAVMRATGADRDAAKAYIDGLDATTQAALRDRDPTLAPIVRAIREERAARRPSVDTGTALAGLMALAKPGAPLAPTSAPDAPKKGKKD